MNARVDAHSCGPDVDRVRLRRLENIMSADNPVVVGIDGSQTSHDALDVAASEAARLSKPLRIVHVHMWSVLYGGRAYLPELPEVDGAGIRSSAQRLLDDAVTRVAKKHPDVPVTTAMPTEAPAPAMITESRDASIVVVGSRGLGGFRGLVLGSVSVQVSAHAECPVLVVPPDTGQITGPVIVGVDGSEPSDRALRRGFERAQDTGVSLIAVHAWLDPVSAGAWDGLPPVYDLAAIEEEAEGVLADALAGWTEKYPDVTVERRLVREHPAKALVAEASPGALIVVGSRGRGGFRGLLLGSVSQSVLHHAANAVEIVR